MGAIRISGFHKKAYSKLDLQSSRIRRENKVKPVTAPCKAVEGHRSPRRLRESRSEGVSARFWTAAALRRFRIEAHDESSPTFNHIPCPHSS